QRCAENDMDFTPLIVETMGGLHPKAKDFFKTLAKTLLIFPRCMLYNQMYAIEEKKKREESVHNPEVNKYVLLKNVDIAETEESIKDSLEQYDYKVKKIERFKQMHIIKILMENAEDVTKILKDTEMCIGYRHIQTEIYDNNRRRPRRYFRQCKKCFCLNHIEEDCNKKQVCKYCGKQNHKSENCRFKKNTKKYRCVLCKGQHRSDSLMCPKTQQVREQIGIKYTRHEQKIIEKQQHKIENNEKMNGQGKIYIKNKIQNETQKVNTLMQETTKQNRKTQNDISTSANTAQKINILQKTKDNKQNEEIKELREQLFILRDTVNNLTKLVEALIHSNGMPKGSQISNLENMYFQKAKTTLNNLAQ
ncbi:hypothetical protein RFI_33930, partial [Reticulomyxa filosa]